MPTAKGEFGFPDEDIKKIFYFTIAKTLIGNQIPAWAASITKKDQRKPNILKFVIIKGNGVTINDEVKFYDLDNNYTFGGLVQKPIDSTGVQTLEVADYSIILSQISVNEVFDIGDTYAEIIEYLIDTYTDFTFVNNLGFTTPTLTKPLIRRDRYVGDVINELLQIINGSFKVDKDKVFTLFQFASTTNENDLENGVDALIKPWETDNNLTAEKVVVKGAVINQRTQETLSGTGTVFNTTRIAENIEIAGLTQTTETIVGDYTAEIDNDNNNTKITFNGSKTDPDVNYTYQSQIRVVVGEGKTVTLEKKYIQTKSEARKLAREYYANFKDGASSSKWIKDSNAIEDYEVGEIIAVTDTINDKSGEYKIKQIRLEYPSKLYITVGEDPEDLFDFQKESIDRIKQLEQRDSNSDFITSDSYIISDLKVNVSPEITELKAYINDGAVLWASDTTLATDADLISDTGLDEDYAIAYDDDGVPSENVIDYLNP